MLRITHNTDEIKIRFDHRFCGPHEIEGHTGICVDEDRRCSLATVFVNDDFVGKGMAVCHPIDNFCKSIGRKKALADSLYSLDKSERTAVWREYEARCGF